MVGGDASTFACAWLNKMIRGKKWTWQEFTTLVEGNFWSTNEKGWNRKALSSLKQGSTPMNTFITRFNTFQALTKYPEDWLIELLKQNANQQIVEMKQPIKQVNCLRSSTRQCKPLIKVLS